MDDDDKKPELREVSEVDLRQILADHQRWVETDGEEGKANLRDADLRGANLTYAKNLIREQLDEACGDDETTLPNYLADYKMKVCPKPAQPPSN